MGSDGIGRDEARAALAKVSDQRAAVRRADLDRLGLVVLAAVNVSYSALIVALAHRTTFTPFLIAASVIPMAAFSLWRDRNERVFSRAGKPIWWTSLAVYLAWMTVLLFWITPRIGWHSSPPDWHLVVVSLAAVLPLLVGAWLIGRVR
jgi:hypothetical protein